MTRDLTVGKPMGLILSFALPTLFGMLFQQLYNMVDTMIVGKLLGANALGAVGSTGAICFFVIGFCMGLCNGFAIPVAQRTGAGDGHNMRRFVANSAYLCLFFSVALTVVTALGCRWILRVMQTPAELFNDAYAYIFIMFLGIPVIILYNMLSGIIRSLGDSKTPVYFLALSSVLNIVLDFAFILCFHAGVAGAALATVISQAVSGVACLFFMLKRYPQLRMTPEERRFDLSACKVLCGMGIPMGLQYSITAIGSIIMQSAVNTLGSLCVSAVAAANKLSQLLCCPFDALGATMATYCGQNVGAVKLDRLGKGIGSAVFLGAVYSALSLGVMLLFAEECTMLFLSPNEPQLALLTSLTVQYILVNAAFFLALTILNVVRFSIQGMGFSNLAIVSGVLEMIARTVMGQWIVPVYGYAAACFASPVAWMSAIIFLIPACAGCIRHLRKTYVNT